MNWKPKKTMANFTGILSENDYQSIKSHTEQARKEPVPTADSVWDYTYFKNENADWRKF